MTVLGNIVAVTSIIAVVSLIQGLNASVKEAILNQAGADSFNIQQFPITSSDEEFEKVRGNPRITLQPTRARSGGTARWSRAVMAESTGSGADHLSRQVDRQRPGPRRHVGVRRTSRRFDAERGRLMSPTEVEAARPVAVDRLADRRSAVRRRLDPLEKTIQIEGVHFRVVGVSAEARLVPRPVAGRVRRDPARPVPDDVRARAGSCR